MPEPHDIQLRALLRTALCEHEMLAEDGLVLVMVSGGGDSSALLHLLATNPPEGVRQVYALHVNHQLRDEDAQADEAFVRDLCGTYGVPLRVVEYDVAGYAAKHGLNLEDAGRQIRYRFAEEEIDALCAAEGLPAANGRIVTGHTRDDRVETFLMRLAQGAGATGLTSLKAVRGRVIRPLIAVSREQLRSYLAAVDIAWREDASNLDTARLRARIRHDLVPVLRGINPRFDEALERTLDILAQEDLLISEMADAFASDFVEHDADEIRFDRAMMATLSVPMRRRTIRSALDRTFPEASRIELEHIDALVSGLESEQFARDLPEGLRAFSEYDRMVVSRGGEGAGSLAPRLLRVPGMLDLGPAGTVVAEESTIDQVAGDARHVAVDIGDLDELIIDSPHDGDRMRPLGMDGTKKLSDMLIDAKVPKRERGITPVVRDGESIVWLAGVRMSEKYKVTEASSRVVSLTWSPVDERDGGT